MTGFENILHINNLVYTEKEARQKCKEKELTVLSVVDIPNDLPDAFNKWQQFLLAHNWEGKLYIFVLKV